VFGVLLVAAGFAFLALGLWLLVTVIQYFWTHPLF
jgi:hypothetical protein